MPSRIANESEHRRGLVLGLTLAEVLLLLLFLILLVLGDRLVRAETARTVAETELTKLRDLLPPGTSDVMAGALARIEELEKAVADLKKENARLRTELTEKTQKLGALEPLISAARAIDPTDPPAVLKLAIDMVEAVGAKIDKERWKSWLEISSTLNTAERSMTKEEREQLHRALLIFISSGGAMPGHKWPPIIRLSEADGYFFAVGSAELTIAFEQQLAKSVTPEILRIAREFQVDVIEVVGHTDEQAIAPRPSNLDTELLMVIRGQRDVKTMIPADNAGLGLIRAVAVVEALKKDRRLNNFRLLPLSGAQLIEVGGTLSPGTARPNVKERRRIEIRMRKAN